MLNLEKILLIALALCIVADGSAAPPAFQQVRAEWRSSEGMLLDRDGRPLHELRVDPVGRRLQWIALDQVSVAARTLLVNAEDKRFVQHKGVDWLALSGAAAKALLGGEKRGASTISMQVAAQLDHRLRPARSARTVAQKWEQMQAALELEQYWSKNEILEAYLNLSTFRGELQGIAAAARGLFGKEAGGLDEAESLVLAALLRGPNADASSVAQRACALSRALRSPVNCETLGLNIRVALGKTSLTPLVDLAPHVARDLLSVAQPRRRVTIDADLQAVAVQALREQLAQLAPRNVHDGAVLAVDNASGEVLVYVGNGGEQASAWYVDGVQAPRQAGSTLKPFLYQLALEQKLLTAASLLDDSAVNVMTPGGLYVPQNYDREFHGMSSVRIALASSLNVPAVRTLMLVGVDGFAERLRTLGFDEITRDGDYYGYSLALGSAEVSLWQLVNAYRTLANGGRLSSLTLVQRDSTGGRKVLAAAPTFIVTDILSDAAARSVTFGLENELAPRFFAAVKTGTSKDMRDNWCIGYNARFTVGVWVGNFDGGAMHNVSGVTGAAPVWLELMNYLNQKWPSGKPPWPTDLVTAAIQFDDEIEAARDELFLSGTEATQVSLKRGAALRARIAYPGAGTIVALDPDIPAAVQRMQFAMRPEAHGYSFRIDGEELAVDATWSPVHGKHVLDLIDGTGRIADSVHFTVRGNAGTAKLATH